MLLKRIAMRQVRDVLRLNAAGVSGRSPVGSGWRRRRVRPDVEAARCRRARLAIASRRYRLELLEGGSSPQPARSKNIATAPKPEVGSGSPGAERKHVTLQILWDEYIEQNPDGYRYSRFCELPRLGIAHLGHDAADPRRRRQACCRLRRRRGAEVIIDRLTGKPAGASLRRRAGRFNYLRRGELDPSARRLDQRPQEHSRRSARFPTCWCRTTPRSL